MMTLSTHLVFAGQCEAAFRFYVQVLGGTMGPMLAYGATPARGDVPTEWNDKIVHGTITLGGMQVCGADVRPEEYAKPQGFYLLHAVSDPAEAEQIFALLADGGEVRMPLQKTFWSPAFGALVDRFGIPWEVTCADEP
jgi:PhnB protein